MPRSRADRAEAPATTGEAAEVRLIGRVAAGDLRAFEQLYRAYHARLARFLDRVTRRQALVEEVLNDTMLVVWNRSDRFNGTSKVCTWIFAIAYRRALKALEVLQRHDAGDSDAAPDDCIAGTGSPEQHLSDHEAQRRLEHALQMLSEEHRAVVELSYFHDLGYREIAQIVGCPVDTVKTRMFHARRRLRALLAGEAEDWL